MLMNLEIMFQFCLVMGVTIAISSNNWFSIWTGLELSLMSFMPIMSNKLKLNSESCIKYFIIQSLSSAIMMMGVIMMATMIDSKFMLIMSIMLKLGMSPFHSWILSMVEGVKYYPILILFTLMKAAPLNMISYINVNLNLIIMISLMVGSISGFNQNSVKKLLSYSSIVNMSFILSCINNYTIWATYLILYSISMLMLISILMKLNLNFINQMMFNNYSNSIKLTPWIIMLSMGGFPPLIGFFAKLLVIKYIILTKNIFMLTFMITMSLITMFFYIRMMFISMMFFHNIPKWMTTMKFKFNSYMLISTLTSPMILFNLKS
uniref:NADH dehydrogenase subunit 2 n=1 Tax=Choucentrus sinensis TaxID=3038122 RepID=UPI00315DAF71